MPRGRRKIGNDRGDRVIRSWRELPLRRRVRLVTAGLAVAGVLVASLFYFGAASVSAWHRASARITAEANVAAQADALALDANDDALVRSALDVLLADPNVRSVVLRDRTGQVIAARPESARALARNGNPPRGFATYGLDVPVQPSLARSGTLHVEVDLKGELLTALNYSLIFTLAIGAVTTALVALLLRYLAQGVHAPVERLLGSVRELRAGGDLQGRPGAGAHDEFGALREEFNHVVAAREASESNLRAYKSEFERRVLERTRQMDAAVAESQAAVKRAEDASRAKSDFLARMSHEIRTPLNGVLGMAELLQDSPKLDERQRRYAVVIHQSGKALLQLINDILDFSKIEAGKLELDKGRFNVREMVEDALEIMAERAQSKGLELICDIPPELDAVVFGDSLRLRQVIINLVGNAVKFTERGDISVRVAMQPGEPTADFTFEVIDTGIGIEAKSCAEIFEAFVQADPSASRRYGGTGLGLAICKQLVQLMSGTIGVESTPGKGSNFHFSVPLTVDRTSARDRSSRALSGIRVLVVEESAAVRRMLRQHLQSWGAICAEVESSESALKRLRQAFSGEFEALILDTESAGTTPAALVAAVRDIPAFAETPILMLYAGSGEPPPEAANVHGPVGWQNKPIRRSALSSALERLLGKTGFSRPEVAKQPSEPGKEATPAPTQSRARRVLVVEDNPVNQEVVMAMLQKLDWEADLASGGMEALEKLAAARYDLVLMDCQMPDLDGYETTRRLREWELVEGRPRMPVVALTANALGGEAEKCLAAGMDRHLSKPLSIEQLRAALASPTTPVETRAEVRQHTAETLDANAIERIRGLSTPGKPDLFERLAAIYASSSMPLVDLLRRAALTGDAAGLRQAAHGLKSSSQNVGAVGLAAICQEIEIAADQSRLEVAEELVERLISEHEKVLESLGQRALAASA
jgi:two-component system, sensor histidine kinase and response regulator